MLKRYQFFHGSNIFFHLKFTGIYTPSHKIDNVIRVVYLSSERAADLCKILQYNWIVARISSLPQQRAVCLTQVMRFYRKHCDRAVVRLYLFILSLSIRRITQFVVILIIIIIQFGVRILKRFYNIFLFTIDF